ncbi:MAG TPA: hypothetical protein VL400_03045 [Polyangiaceae bacterium]|nr:hypothetical protein [Polyangiaceae bacterium]
MSDAFEASPRAPGSGDGAAGSSEEDPRQLGARVVNALYRLVKACQLHSDSNQAVAQVVEFVQGTVGAYCDRTHLDQIAILFTKQAVFVNRQMLRASRETYQLALELGAILESFDVTEITLSKQTSAVELSELGRYLSELREGKKHPRLLEGGWDGLRLRKVVGFSNGADLSPPTRAARTYAAALMLVRGFYADIRAGNYELKQGIKRVAQKLVSQNDAGARMLVTIAATPSPESDRAAILLNTAVLAVAMAAQVTDDRTLLTSIASAALLYDTGRQRLVGYSAGDAKAERRLNQDEEDLLPTSAMVALTALGKVHPPNVTRAVLVHEALALRDGHVPYGGKRQPALLSRILHAARSFIEQRVPRSGALPIGIDDTIEILESQATDNTGRAIIKLLVGALGVFPAGTMVELSTGEMAVVLATPRLPVDFARPPVRIMYDARAQLLSEPFDVDLAELRDPGAPIRFIVKTVDATDQQMKQMRAYVVQLAQNRARKRSADKMRAVAPPPVAPPPVSTPAPTERSIEAPKPPLRDHQAGTRRWDPRAEDFEEIAGRPIAPAPHREPISASRASKPPVSVASLDLDASPSAPAVAPLSEAPPQSPRDAATDALLAAYLAEEAESAGPPSRRSEPVSSGGRSHGLRWSDRSSSPGASADVPSQPPKSSGGASAFSTDRSQTPVAPGAPARAATLGFGAGNRAITGAPPSTSGFGSQGRGITGAPPSSTSGFGSQSRGITGAPSSTGFGSQSRSITGGPVTPASFGSEGRGITGGRYAGLRLGGSPSSPGHDHAQHPSSRPPHDSIADGSTATPTPAPPPLAPRAAQEPLRGSLGRVNSAANWAAVREAPPASLEPKVSEVANELQPSPDPPPASTVEPVQSRRAKAGTSSWSKK